MNFLHTVWYCAHSAPLVTVIFSDVLINVFLFLLAWHSQGSADGIYSFLHRKDNDWLLVAMRFSIMLKKNLCNKDHFWWSETFITAPLHGMTVVSNAWTGPISWFYLALYGQCSALGNCSKYVKLFL